MSTGSAGVLFHKNELIRKAITGGVFIAPITAAAITKTNLFDPTTGDITGPLPTGYRELGLLDASGAAFARTTKATDITSWQSITPTRTDITSDDTTLKIAPQEMNISTLALFLNVATSAITLGTNGAIEVDRPETSIPTYWRVLAIGVDTTTYGEIVYARFLPRAMVTTWDSQSMANGSDPLEFGVTLTSYVDSVLGYSESYLIGGAGHLAYAVDEGFSRTVTVTTNSTTALVATTGSFYPNDVGSVVSGTGITPGTTIASYTDATHVTMSAVATASGSGVVLTLAAEL